MEPFDHPVQRPRVRVPQEVLVLLVGDVGPRELVVHPVVDHPGRRIETEEVVHRGRELEGALVAVPAHRRHPARVDHPGSEHAGRLLSERARADRVGSRRVADVGARGRAGQGPDRRDHAAVVLEVVVAVGDVVLARVDVLGGDVDAAVGALHVAPGRHAVELPAVGEAAPRRIDLREVLVVAPVARLDEREDARAVGTRLRAEDPCRRAALVAVLREVGLRVRPDVVVVVALVEGGDEPERVVEQVDDVRERVAEESRDADRDVDPRVAQLLQRDGVESDDATRHLVPAGPDADQGEDLGDVVAGRPHRRGPPDREAHGARPLPRVGAMPREKAVRHRLPGLPREPRRDRLGVDRVEVAARGQDVDQPAQRGPRRAGRDVAAVERVQDRVHLARRAEQARDDLVAREGQ